MIKKMTWLQKIFAYTTLFFIFLWTIFLLFTMYLYIGEL